ncbi:MFS transporter [Corynebacterium sp. SCR221107]|uniref:MFS transporter n=1 Tax=Corynebacterium sp. SCR221107 TaxID=3017361 RepID=UPI0022EC8A2B|nr:MFS transporter [Corynebacterium sp. SCR221107]WBT07972.1 MFS transporter [Corynebacterium sp. SCR221107]
MSSPSQPTAASGQALLTIPGLGWLLAAVALAFAAFSIMLPIAPLAVLDAGGSKVVAGVATTAFMVVTVLTQLATATLISRFGYRRVMLVATAFLSMPALIQVFVTDPWGIVAISALRGIGFGTVCVTQYALVAKLVPEGMFGRASGAIGVAAGFAQMATLPLGVIVITTAAGFHGAYLITAIVGLAGLAVCFFVPEPAQTRRAPQTRTREEPTSQPGQQKERDHRGGLIKLFALPACALASVSMSYGAISSFLPDTAAAMDPTVGAMLAGIMLSVIGGAQMVARYAAGVIADRGQKAGVLLPPGLILTAMGMAGIGLVVAVNGSVWWFLALVLVFGIGFGVVQNETMLVMFARGHKERIAQASTAWNVSFDSGTGLGSVLFGAVATIASTSGAYYVAGVVILAATVAVIIDARVGGHRNTTG